VLVFFICCPLSSVAAFECADATTTIEMEFCAQKALTEAQTELMCTIESTLKTFQGDKEKITLFKNAQKQWTSYRDLHCGLVYDRWRDGSIRNLITISCKVELTQQRTNVLQRDFLTF